MDNFIPDYTNLVKAARNIKPGRLPLYEHNISIKVIESIMGREIRSSENGGLNNRRDYFKKINNFYKMMGYDTVSYEVCITYAMPGSGALRKDKPGAIRNMEDFKKYPWHEIPDMLFKRYSNDFKALDMEMPIGMKAVGGLGNGIFEIVEDMVGFEKLCYISSDDPELYTLLFKTVGDMVLCIWDRFMKQFSDVYAVLRVSDDLGFRSTTLLNPNDIRKHILPQYKRIADLVHSYAKPFLLHSCGAIFDVMDDLINSVGIDAKHSNEDLIAPFSKWMELYGDRIGLFGGMDVSYLCDKSEDEIKSIARNILTHEKTSQGFAFGSGNSIPSYVPVEGYIAMIEAAREYRGER